VCVSTLSVNVQIYLVHETPELSFSSQTAAPVAELCKTPANLLGDYSVR
jgi:hypothetical protein